MENNIGNNMESDIGNNKEKQWLIEKIESLANDLVAEENKLISLRVQGDELKGQIKEVEDQLAELNRQYKMNEAIIENICGRSYGYSANYGTLANIKKSLKLYQDSLAIADNPKPVLCKDSRPLGPEYRVYKITPKRIYVRNLYKNDERYYSRRDGRENSWTFITLDVEKTLEAWDAYKAQVAPDYPSNVLATD